MSLHHLAVIMDGNGRWATSRGLPRVMGHQAGYEAMKRLIRQAPELEIKVLTFYCFSTENWARPVDEVDFLMSLPSRFVEQELPELMANNVKVLLSGRLDQVPKAAMRSGERVVAATQNNTGLIVNLAFNYGGRAELLDALQAIAADCLAGRLEPQQITEETVRQHLYQGELPDPDLILRTSGEQRLSNFLLWQSAYSELYFSNSYWPDFDRLELEQIVRDFQQRVRRFGGITQGAP